MKHTTFCLLLPLLVLSACKKVDKDELDAQEVETVEPIGSYDIDPESGEVRASHTDAAGVTTTMRAGKKVRASFPEPFTAYPGAKITNTTRVDQGDGLFVTMEFITPDPRAAVVAFYRSQADEAQIEPDVEVNAGETTTLGGENAEAKSSFALQVTRISGQTKGQLSVASGIR